MRVLSALFVLLALIGASHPLRAETFSSNDIAKIKMSLAGKELALKGYPWAPVIGYSLTDGHLKTIPSGTQELSVFTLDEVRERNGYLELHGKQKLFVRNDATKVIAPTPITAPVILVLSLSDVPDLNALGERLESDLFFGTVEEAVAAIPVWQRPCLPARFSPASNSLLPREKCEPAKDARASVPPKLLKGVDPPIPDSVRSEGPGRWRVAVTFTLNEQGVPESVHVVIPSYLVTRGTSGRPLSDHAAKDLDSSAVTAVKQYRFRPATKDGIAIPTPSMVVSVAFEVFAQ